MSDQDPGYSEGLRDGRLKAVEESNRRAHDRLDGHDTRLSAQERITYSLLGALALLQIWPAVERFIGQ